MQQTISSSLMLALATVAVVIVLSATPAGACSTSGFAVGNNLNTQKVPETVDGSFIRYGPDQVSAHISEQDEVEFASMTLSSYACVDARGDNKQLGTPGGDMAEMIAAVMAFFKSEQRRVNKASIKVVFDAFFDRVASRRRPLYFHTDDFRLRMLYAYMGTVEKVFVNGQPPSVLPEVAPTDMYTRNKWLKNLVKSEYQGCGHVRLMLQNDTTKLYSVRSAGDAVVSCDPATAGTGPGGYSGCISAKEVAEEVIRLWFERWWPTPVLSRERQRVRFQVDVGPLQGKAVTAISQTTTTGRCRGMAPLIRPNFAGSTLFVYHGQAVKEFRRFAARRLGLGVNATRLAATWDAIADMQLGATLGNLPPANGVGLFPVTITTSG